jgi:ADP-ribose pyrophosphatase
MNPKKLPKWKTVASKYLVNDRWLKLRADTCITPDGTTIEPWYVLEYPEWINCVAIDKDHNVAVLKHYRHGIDDYVLEIIGGNCDTAESPLSTLKRELYEEIGYTDGQIYQTGVTYANPSSQNNKMYSFLAVGGTFSHSTFNETGADFQIIKMPFMEFVKEFTDNQSPNMYQSLHLTGIFLTLNFIERTNYDNTSDLKQQLIGNTY